MNKAVDNLVLDAMSDFQLLRACQRREEALLRARQRLVNANSHLVARGLGTSLRSAPRMPVADAGKDR